MTRRSRLPRAPFRAVATVAASVLVAGLLLAVPAAADQPPTSTIGDVTLTETDSGTTSAVFTITLTQSSPNRTTIVYSTADSSARAPGDYTPTAGQLVFPAGTTSKTVAVDVVGDTRYEGDEGFYLNVSSPSGALVPDGTGVATIVDDDPRPYLSVGDTTVVEGNTGTVAATFPVTLDRASENPVRVRYDTSNGSAAAGTDFTYTKGTLTIPAGHTSASVTVPVTGDTFDEGRNEYFYLNLSAPSGAQLISSQAAGIIVDDESSPFLAVTDSAVVEGNTGTTSMVFTVSLSRASPNPVIAYYGTADGSATTADYTPTFGTLSFAPGQVSKTVGVAVTGDTVDEGSAEYLVLYLQNVSGAVVSESSAFGEIVDNDPAVSADNFLTVDTTSVAEGDSGAVNATFTVLLQPAAGAKVTVNYATNSNSATAGSDFTTTAGTLAIAKGATSATITVPVLGDDLIEGDEQFYLSLSGAVNATIDDSSAPAIIVDDDIGPVASVADTTVVEGDTGTTGDAAFEISLSGASPVTASVVYTTNNSGATAPGDYTGVSGTAVFQPGETSKVVHVPIVGDTADENDELFFVYLSSPSNVLTTDNYGYAVIVDDDRFPSLSVDDPSVYEGTTGTVQALFTVTMDSPSVNTVSVNYATDNGAAGAPGDYTAVAGTLTFAPGQTTQTVAVTVQGDTLDENTEYLYLYLGSPTNATLQDSQGVLYILDDDTMPSISIGEASAVEPDSGTVSLTFPVTLSAATANTVTVNYGTSDGSAVASTDYTGVSGTLTFAPGETSKTITVSVTADTVHENIEYLNLGLGSPSMAVLRDGYSYGTVYDNDPLPNLTVDETGIVEGDSGTKNATFTVTLQPATPNPVTVSYGTSDGSATAGGSDYVTTTGTLSFAAGQTSKTVNVPVNGDTLDEGNEYFGLSLTGPTNAGVIDSIGYVTVFDNDPSGSGSILSVDDATVVEPDSGTTNAVFRVTLTPAATSRVTVNYSTDNREAVAGDDFIAQYGTLTFAPGQTSATVTVPVVGDTLDENNQSFSLSLFSGTGPFTSGDTTGFGIILDNERTPLVAIGDATVTEGSAGTVDAVFTVRLLAPSPQPLSVDWDTRDGSALAPGDYQDDGGTLNFAPGQTSKVVRVTVNGDDLVEGDEVFYVDLSRNVGVSRASSETTGVGVILDNDTFAVMGAVTRPDGAGVSGTTLTLTGNNLPASTTTTGSTGAFAFDDVPDGQYTVTPTASGKSFVPASYPVNVRGGSLTGYRFIAVTNPSVSGRVVDAAGDPVPGVTITRKGNSQPDATTTTNGMGYYAFVANPAGTYTIRPTLPGATFNPVQKSVTQTATNAVTANFAKA